LNMILLLNFFALQKILLNSLEVIKRFLLTGDGDQKYLNQNHI
jgi:16S rRNA (guanine966-N2)-methyltransferase